MAVQTSFVWDTETESRIEVWTEGIHGALEQIQDYYAHKERYPKLKRIEIDPDPELPNA